MIDQPDPREPEPAAPARLVEGLRALHNQTLLVPGALDECILARARAHLAATSRPRRMLPAPRWLAAVATLALGIGLFLLLSREHPRTGMARADIDSNGRIDILDAFALARKLQSGTATDPALDLNGDGRLDQQDVDWLAAQAVKLRKG